MLTRLELACARGRPLTIGADSLLGPFAQGLPLQWLSGDPATSAAPGVVEIAVSRFRHETFDPRALDEAVTHAQAAGPAFALRVRDDGGNARLLLRTAAEVLTRYQRLLAWRNRHAEGPAFEGVLEAHRALHDRSKPLVAADHDHALDTWRWVLRLDPDASLAVQVAALFHDVERLVSESEVRVEHHAPDYVAFKRAHAAEGARLARRILARVGIGRDVRNRVEALITAHEDGARAAAGDPEVLLLGEADALSFFNINACGFLAYYGLAHTQKKVAYTLARLGPRGRHQLGRIRHRADLGALIDAATLDAPDPRPPGDAHLADGDRRP